MDILNNSKEFFDSLTDEQFDALLKQFGFEYKEMRNLTKEEQEYLYEALDEISEDTGIQLFDY